MNRSSQDFSSGENDPVIALKQRMLAKKLTVTALAKKLKRSRRATSRALNHPLLLPKLHARIVEAIR